MKFVKYFSISCAIFIALMLPFNNPQHYADIGLWMLILFDIGIAWFANYYLKEFKYE